MSLTIPQLLVMLGAALLALALFTPRTRSLPIVPAIAVAAIAENSAATHPSPSPLQLAWPQLVDSNAADLDADGRRALLEALVAIGEPWCAPILRVASDEERDDRLAAIARAGIAAISSGDAPRADAA